MLSHHNLYTSITITDIFKINVHALSLYVKANSKISPMTICAVTLIVIKSDPYVFTSSLLMFYSFPI